MYDLCKMKNFDHPAPHIYSQPILVCPSFCCTTMDVQNWIQKDSLLPTLSPSPFRKMMFRNIPHKLQQWDKYTYT